MGIKEIGEAVHKKFGLTKVQSIGIVEEVFHQVEEQAIYNPVRVPIGTFRYIETKERPGRNPRTGETVTVPASKKLKFKAKKK